MIFKKSPTRWADDVIRFGQSMGHSLFPIDVGKVAKEYSRNFFPDEPIIHVHGDQINGTEGVMLPIPGGGWVILYNASLTPQGRINFTLAHEFGHYLLHRHNKRKQFRTQNQSIEWQKQIVEKEADKFAVNLLMPLFDFQDQIGPQDTVDLERLISCAERYGVSLTAAIRRWLEYTEKRAVMVIVVKGQILWSLASSSAFKAHSYISRARGSVKIPQHSLAANPGIVENALTGMKIPDGTWLDNEKGVLEMVSFSDKDDSAISLLVLSDFPEEKNSTNAISTQNDQSGIFPENDICQHELYHKSEYGNPTQEFSCDDFSQEPEYEDFTDGFSYEEFSQEIEYGDFQNEHHCDEFPQEPQYDDDFSQDYDYDASFSEFCHDEHSQVWQSESESINSKSRVEYERMAA